MIQPAHTRWQHACVALDQACAAMRAVHHPSDLTGPAIALVTTTTVMGRISAGQAIPRTLQHTHREATEHWHRLSTDPRTQLAVLRWLDPQAVPDVDRPVLAGLILPGWQYPLIQLSLALGLVPGDPMRVWSRHHQLMLLTATAADTLASGTAVNGVRVAGGQVQRAVPSSPAAAETAAALWTPGDPAGAYQDLAAAARAAEAVLAGQQPR